MSRNARAKPAKTANSANLIRRATEDFAAGNFAAAAKRSRQVVKVMKRSADVWHLLAASLLECHDIAAAYKAITMACKLAPGHPDYCNTYALILDHRGDALAAETRWRDLLAREPQHADGWYNLGRQLVRRGYLEQGIQCLANAVRLRPGWTAAHQNLGFAHFTMGDTKSAEAAYLDALKGSPGDHDTLISLARLRQHEDDVVGAMRFYRQSLENGPDAATLLRFALLRPIFGDSTAALIEHRARVLDNLAHLQPQAMELQDPAKTVGAACFYFAYDGINDRELMSRVGDIVATAWRPQPLPRATRHKSRPRIAFVSAYFKQHTIGRLYAPLLEQLPRDNFDIALLSVGRHDDAMATRIRAAADHAIAVGDDHSAAREALHELDADVVFFPDIGMHSTTFWLAAERHAPVQAVSWGHPVTTGLPTIDYFLSSQMIEPTDGASHYREALVELPAWLSVYDDPGPPEASEFSRKDLDLAAGQHLYLCPQTLFKLHPEFDFYLGEILRRDPSARILLIDWQDSWRKRVMARLHAHLGNLCERIRFVPKQSNAGYYAMLAAADVVLDTLPFSGGISTFETIWAETPFVTERGAFMRGRVSAGLCDLLGLDSAVTRGAAEYAERAMGFAHDGPERRSFIAQLGERKRRLLELNDAVIPAYAGFFDHAIATASNNPAARLAS